MSRPPSQAGDDPVVKGRSEHSIRLGGATSPIVANRFKSAPAARPFSCAGVAQGLQRGTPARRLRVAVAAFVRHAGPRQARASLGGFLVEPPGGRAACAPIKLPLPRVPFSPRSAFASPAKKRAGFVARLIKWTDLHAGHVALLFSRRTCHNASEPRVLKRKQDGCQPANFGHWGGKELSSKEYQRSLRGTPFFSCKKNNNNRKLSFAAKFFF